MKRDDKNTKDDEREERLDKQYARREFAILMILSVVFIVGYIIFDTTHLERLISKAHYSEGLIFIAILLVFILTSLAKSNLPGFFLKIFKFRDRHQPKDKK